MAFIHYGSVAVVTATGGAATGRIVVPNGGLVLAVGYTKASTDPFSNGVGLAVTVEETGQAVLALASGGSAMDATLVKYPHAQVHGNADGVALTLDGTRTKTQPVPMGSNQTLKFVVNAGGDAKNGTFWALVG